jgi:hypothetical protein
VLEARVLALGECYGIRYGCEGSQLSIVNGSQPDRFHWTLGNPIEFEDVCASSMSDSVVHIQQAYLLNRTINTSLYIGQILCMQLSSVRFLKQFKWIRKYDNERFEK